MIARNWRGYTRPENADAYEAMLKPELLPGVGKVICSGATWEPRLSSSLGLAKGGGRDRIHDHHCMVSLRYLANACSAAEPSGPRS